MDKVGGSLSLLEEELMVIDAALAPVGGCTNRCVQHRPRCESGGAERACCFTVLRLDVPAHGEVVFQLFECLLDLGEADVVLPQGGGVFMAQVGT